MNDAYKFSFIVAITLCLTITIPWIAIEMSDDKNTEGAVETSTVDTLDEAEINEILPIIDSTNIIFDPVETEEIIETEIVEAESEPADDFDITSEEIALMAMVVMAEAGGECEEGKRLVIDTILNRVDHPKFPDTVHDVLWQPYHFSTVWSGAIYKREVTDDIYRLIEEELKSRLNYNCIYFRADHYSKYGEPMFQVGGHYFSSYE